MKFSVCIAGRMALSRGSLMPPGLMRRNGCGIGAVRDVINVLAEKGMAIALGLGCAQGFDDGN
jgi:hypothetical protein